MCGIVGVIGESPDKIREAVVKLLLQSQIRGKHATGISYVKDGKIVTIKKPIPAMEFIELIPKDIGNIVIGHTRYSTSDSRYNQPLDKDNISLVHNGVITQAPFEQWEELYGLRDFTTRNDSEILLKTCCENKDMFGLLNFEESSIAAGIIKHGELWCFRNNRRPLYLFNTDDVLGFASTENIIKRALKTTLDIYKCKPNKMYNLYFSKGIPFPAEIEQPIYETEIEPPIHETEEDLQFNTVRGLSYLNGKCIHS